MESLWLPLWTSLRVACFSTLLALPVGIGVAWLAAQRKTRQTKWLDVLILFPLLLPTPVLGYYLLLAFRFGPVSALYDLLWGNPVVFSEAAAMVASAIYTFPITALLAHRVFQGIPASYVLLAQSLGATDWQIFRQIAVPLAAKPLAAIGVLTLARSLGDFGITLLVAGSVDGGSVTMPTALYLSLHAGQAGTGALFAILLTLLIVAFLFAAQMLSGGRLLR